MLYTGTPGNDTFAGTSDNDTLNGNGGQDSLLGGFGDDVVTGDDGDDHLLGGWGSDTLSGGGGYDVLDGEFGNDVLSDSDGGSLQNGGTGFDTLTGGTGADVLNGGDHGDRLDGGGGSDILTDGAAGNTDQDTLLGGSGDDILLSYGGADRVDGGAGLDAVVLNLSASSQAVSLDMALAATALGITLDNGTVLANIELGEITGGSGNDTLTGAAQADFFVGSAGNDVLSGRAGNDVLDGGDGEDWLAGGAGNDTLIGGAGEDTADYSSAGGAVQLDLTVTTAQNTNAAGIDQVTGIEHLIGSAYTDLFVGNAANNRIDGGAGADTLAGGAGDDTYWVEAAGDRVIEKSGEGVDLVYAAISYSLTGNFVEFLTLTGSADINATGNGMNNFLTGNEGNNVLDGATGNDLMAGGLGNDTYYVQTAGDIVVENHFAGTDTVYSTISYSLFGRAVEILTLTGTANINATGNSLANALTGNAGNNLLDGDAGNDTLTGGLGNDTYVINSVGDVIVEAAGEGIDTVRTSINYTLAAGSAIEAVVLTGSRNLNATGNAQDNALTGNAFDNRLLGRDGNDALAGGGGQDSLNGGTGRDTLSGQDGNDTLAGDAGNDTLSGGNGHDRLDGNLGDDTLAGGTGNDSYSVDSAGDVVQEQGGQGLDRVTSSLSYALGANLEELYLAAGAVSGTGNVLNNYISGWDGDNVLDGGAGSDTLSGGLGNDTYHIDSSGDVIIEGLNQGVDTVVSSFTYSAAANGIETLILSGAGNYSLTGNGFNNTLTGNSGNNLLDGGAGSDTMAGGLGNDSYRIDNAGDVVIETAGGGNDTILVGAFNGNTYVLAEGEIESVTITVAGPYNLTGNSTANTLTGTNSTNFLSGAGGNDVLDGRGGKDTLDGGGGDDTMIGGAGDDWYYLDSAGDVVVELAGGGIDSILAYGSYSLAGTEVENLHTRVGDINDTVTGNALNNLLNTHEGNDYLDGGVGADTMYGGSGDDTYIVDNVSDVTSNNGGTDIVFSSVSYTAGHQVDHLTLTGNADINATGNIFFNILTGNSGNNLLDGGAGQDTLIGGLGNDTYVVDSLADVITEAAGEGFDEVRARTSYVLAGALEALTLLETNSARDATGNAANNVLTGNSLFNLLDGREGQDTMRGGTGDDTYVVDDAGDVIEEQGGYDWVTTGLSYTLGANLEAVTLTGSANVNATGNAAGNVLTGNAGINVLTGGLGDDTYFVQTIGDTVVEAVGQGIDQVNTLVDFSAVGTHIERLYMSGIRDVRVVGNELNNTIGGNDGNNLLDGGTGADTLAGGNGNDTYVIDTAGDQVFEYGASSGIDTVETPFDYTTGTNIENVVLTGTATTATGSSAANSLTGNGLDNTLNGLVGNDSLYGGGGNDALFGGDDFDRLDGGTGADTLTGGTSNDTYVIDSLSDVIVELSGAGPFDTVESYITYTLPSAIERLVLIGNADINGSGDSRDNYIAGNDGINVLTGFTGNDTYLIQNAGDTVVEQGGGGTDEIRVTFSYSLVGVANIERLALTGTADINATGNAGNNVLRDNSGINILTGGLGDDEYYVSNAGDQIVELAGEGYDFVQTEVSYSIAGTEVEYLGLIGDEDDDVDATGNHLDNIISGNEGNNRIDGGGGNDTLYGAGGQDRFVFGPNSGQDLIEDFRGFYEGDRIDVSAYSNGVVHNEWVSQSGNDVVINLGGGNTITVQTDTFNVVQTYIIW
ncbi:hypothetical protein ABAC460_13555 [Asticcacaulis sp. AC460]|uniref:beta strand repeat-containing protein n=1 Tax=Asticcacaulis sp. AC460 TaxID=1282360 RepID=UPI0003C3B5A3|nr:calcium-binding protein [Asticcacaulis sp. AC460]ESQ89090.1 hypothetical protein ABAC460_13555 [Asticcacaulis sp. AC460]